MIVKFGRSGHSFKGLSQYLSHDPKAQTSERVTWTHTLNLANDHVPSAVHEMYQTFLDAEALKEEAGVKRGGQPLQLPVKHFSLNWHLDDQPTKEHMLESTQAFLHHMGWQEHQAIFYAHEDKAHAHVHVMLNAVHPETGLKLDEGLERRRASEWSLAYELQHEQIRCGQRLLEAESREKAPTRAAWEIMKEAEHQYAQTEVMRRGVNDGNGPIEPGDVWRSLKTMQREEREAFFESGKAAYKEARDMAFREVRDAFRPEWRDYYAAQRDGLDADLLRDMKDSLMARQQEALVDSRDRMSQGLRTHRDDDYAAILAEQQAERASFTARIAQGDDGQLILTEMQAIRAERMQGQNDNDRFADRFAGVAETRASTIEEFRSLAAEVCEVGSDDRSYLAASGEEGPSRGETRAENPRVRDGIDLGAALGAAAIGEALTFGERLFEGFLDDAPRPKPPSSQPEPESRPIQQDLFAAAANVARRQAEEEERMRRDECWDDRRSRARE